MYVHNNKNLKKEMRVAEALIKSGDFYYGRQSALVLMNHAAHDRDVYLLRAVAPNSTGLAYRRKCMKSAFDCSVTYHRVRAFLLCKSAAELIKYRKGEKK